MTTDTPTQTGPVGNVRAWSADHIVDIVFVLMVFAGFLYALHVTRDAFYFADDWRLLLQGSSIGGLLKPYNGHLSIIIVGIYRLFGELFGLQSYTPTRIVGLGVLYAVPLAYFFTTRRQFGPVLAALLALPLLWYGKYVDLFAGAFNHYLALLGGIACGAALNRGRRADGVLAGGLAFALCSAGGGVAVAAACVVHNLCMRPPVRRWLAVLAPSLLWLVWWAIEDRQIRTAGPFALSTSQTLDFIRKLGFTPFDSVALDLGVVAVLAFVAYLAYGVWALSRGLRNGANFMAWSVAVVVWGYGIAINRSLLATSTVFRYRYVALGFALLAVVPRSPIRWPARVPIVTDRRWIAAGAVLVVLLGVARALAVRDDMQASGSELSGLGRLTRANVLVLGLGPSVIPNNTLLAFSLGAGSLNAADLRRLLKSYRRDTTTNRATIDEELVAMRAIVLSTTKGPRGGCSAVLSDAKVLKPTGAQIMLRATDTVAVEARRFGEKWLPLGTVKPGRLARIAMPNLSSAQPWQLRAAGACEVSSAP